MIFGVEVVDELAAVGLLEEVWHSLLHHCHGLSLREQPGGADAEDGKQRVVAGATCVDVHVFQPRLLTAEVEDEKGLGKHGSCCVRRGGGYPRPNPLVGNISIACDVVVTPRGVGGTLRGEGGDEPRPYVVTLRAVVVTLRPNILEEILFIEKEHIFLRHGKRAARQILASLVESL